MRTSVHHIPASKPAYAGASAFRRRVTLDRGMTPNAQQLAT
jgi:hypothetical protein